MSEREREEKQREEEEEEQRRVKDFLLLYHVSVYNCRRKKIMFNFNSVPLGMF